MGGRGTEAGFADGEGLIAERERGGVWERKEKPPLLPRVGTAR